jgi:hypothetical protein
MVQRDPADLVDGSLSRVIIPARWALYAFTTAFKPSYRTLDR